MVEAAKSMKEMEEERFKIYKRPVPDREKEFKEDPVIELNLYQLMRAFQKIVTEYEAREVSEIEHEIVTIEEKIDMIMTSLSMHGQVSFHELFDDSSSRLDMIVTFMALLELVKLAKIKSRQEDAFGSIWLYPGEAFNRNENAVQEVQNEIPTSREGEDAG
jgi:segregation and condensation protein A